MIRGLIGIKQKNGSIRYIYNHHNSYPSYLMKNISKALKRKDLNNLKKEMESGEWNNTKINDIIKIDYLWYEYVYIIDFEKKKWNGYKTNKYQKKLIPIMLNINFKDIIEVFTDEIVIKIHKIIKKQPNYKIIYDGKIYYLINNKNEIISKSTNKTDILSKGISEKI